jgi:hypothetical protein
MKKAMLLGAILVLIPVMCFAETICSPGNYTGKLWSIVPDLNGKRATLNVRKEGDKCVMNFKTEGSSEIWELSGKTLLQKEFDNRGKVTQQYGATLERDKYIIDCKNRAKNECDGGIDSRHSWQLKMNPDEIIYTVYGVNGDKRNDPKAAAVKRHEFTFKIQHATKAK